MIAGRIHAVALLALVGDGVERAAGTAAPTAFRIWRAGDNATDYGVHKFTEASAKKIVAEQAKRGNLYSIDCDHLSLNDAAPPESRKAVGWHELEVRSSATGPELWATSVQWTDAVRTGLESNPPEWRYFSPVYDVANETGEIVGYLNCALTNNPATWSVTALATRQTVKSKRIQKMTLSDCLAALMGDDEGKKNAALESLKAAFPDNAEVKPNEATPDPEAKPKKVVEEQTTEEVEPKKKPDDAEKEASIAATSSLAATVARMAKQIEKMTAEKADGDRTAILATRSDLPKELVATLREMPLDLMKRTIAGIPVAAPDPAAAAKVAATRGAHDPNDRAARLPVEEHRAMRQRMGLEAATGGVRREGTAMIFGVNPAPPEGAKRAGEGK